MAEYRINFLNQADRVFGSRHLEAVSDDHAQEKARLQLRSGIGKGYRIWHGDQLVHSEVYG